MAVEFKGDFTRTSEYLFDPSDITVKPEFNGRKNLPEIDTLIDSFVTMGQLQPVLIGRDGGMPVLYDGHRRWRAALEINKRKLTPKPFRLRCVYYQGDEKAAFLATVVANHERKQTDEIDDANNIAIMSRWGMSEQEIASVYHAEVPWVKSRLALLELCSEAQQAYRDGKIKNQSAAIAIAHLSKEAQREKLKAAGEKPITAAMVKESGEPSDKPKRVGLTQVREFWTPYAEREDNKPMTRFAKAQAEWLKTGDTEKYFAAVAEILGEKSHA